MTDIGYWLEIYLGRKARDEMRRDVCRFFPGVDIYSVFNAYVAGVRKAFGKDVKTRPYYNLSFSTYSLSSIKYNFSNGAINVRFMPYMGGTAVNLRYTLFQAGMAAYIRHEEDLAKAVEFYLGRGGSYKTNIPVELFVSYSKQAAVYMKQFNNEQNQRKQAYIAQIKQQEMERIAKEEQSSESVRNQTTDSPQNETTVSPQNETTVSPQNETTVSPQNETTVSPQNESTVSQQNETTIPQQNDTTIPQQNETTIPQQSETTISPQNESSVFQQNGTSFPPQSEVTVPQQNETSVPVQNKQIVLPPNSGTTQTALLEKQIQSPEVTGEISLYRWKENLAFVLGIVSIAMGGFACLFGLCGSFGGIAFVVLGIPAVVIALYFYISITKQTKLYSQKLVKAKILAIIGACVLFLGLIVSIVGPIVNIMFLKYLTGQSTNAMFIF